MITLNLIVTSILFSCTKDRTINLKTEKKQLVVNCTFNPDSTWKLWLSSTISIGENSEYFPAINNATIQLLENGNSIGMMQNVDEGFYTLNSKPSLGNIYSIKISANGFDNVEATDSFPKTKGSILDGTVEKSLIEKKAPPPWVDYFYKILPVKVSISDSKIENNYYKIQAYILPTDQTQFPQFFFDNNFILFTLNAFSTEDKRFDPISWEQNQILFNDNSLQDSTILLNAYYTGFGRNTKNGIDVTKIDPSYTSLKYVNPFYNGINGWGRMQVKDGTGDWKLDYFVELQTLSETYYKYNKTRLLQQYNSKIPGAEFNNVYSNVKEGKGIFGAYLSHKLKLN